MPGKVNPSIPEMVNQVCYQVMGCDLTVAMACEAGQLELNVMMPVIAWNALHSSRILREAMTALRTRCVEGIVADTERARELLDRSPLRPRSARKSATPPPPTSRRQRCGPASIQEIVREAPAAVTLVPTAADARRLPVPGPI